MILLSTLKAKDIIKVFGSPVVGLLLYQVISNKDEVVTIDQLNAKYDVLRLYHHFNQDHNIPRTGEIMAPTYWGELYDLLW